MYFAQRYNKEVNFFNDIIAQRWPTYLVRICFYFYHSYTLWLIEYIFILL